MPRIKPGLYLLRFFRCSKTRRFLAKRKDFPLLCTISRDAAQLEQSAVVLPTLGFNLFYAFHCERIVICKSNVKTGLQERGFGQIGCRYLKFVNGFTAKMIGYKMVLLVQDHLLRQ